MSEAELEAQEYEAWKGAGMNNSQMAGANSESRYMNYSGSKRASSRGADSKVGTAERARLEALLK